MTRGKKWNVPIICLVEILLLIGIDQLIKFVVVQKMWPHGEIRLWNIGDKEILWLRFLENSGAAFSSFAGKQWLLIVMTSIMIIACSIWLIYCFRHSKYLSYTLSLIIAGGMGNLIDRIFRDGLVVDYIDVRIIHFAVFNFADCCVVIGVCLIVFFMFFIEPKIEKRKKKEKELESTDA